MTREGHLREPGPTLSRVVMASADDVWSVLADGWSYANWVVGTAQIRAVDWDWPQPTSKIHHAFGAWPALIKDVTVVESWDPGRDLVLTARGWPAGEARVHVTVRPLTGDRSVVTMTEDAVSGPALLVPALVRRLLLIPRNRESLHRVALVAEGHRRSS